LKLLIKVVTYHGLHIAETAEGYEATVIFDTRELRADAAMIEDIRADQHAVPADG